ncbi:mercuric reductase [Ardenticatena maritima]|uniref:Mercuric reductase n=2 Tax=Ardenticatena maritima TaxID=872965 RepID=A0A0M9UCP5_9CHLR|nr:mercuric reductase [Ardenticatena maritima]
MDFARISATIPSEPSVKGEHIMSTSKTYPLIVIGGGSAGLTAARSAAYLGVPVALVEKERIGGDCTWAGCVPSKALLKAAKVAQTARNAAPFGVQTAHVHVDMPAVRAYVQSVIQHIYAHETPETLQAEGIDVYLGGATFEDPHTIRVGETLRLRGKRFILCTGARPFIPPIEGLESVPFETYETIFNVDRLPQRLIVIGAGPIGAELGQAYARLGARVTLIDVAFLPTEEPEVRTVLLPRLAAEGVTMRTGLVARVARDGAEIAVWVEDDPTPLRGDMLLVATGRTAALDGLGLDAAGVAVSPKGLLVDETLRTSQPHIFAAGDCIADNPQFSHLAGAQGFTAFRNALLPLKSKARRAAVPAVIYTEPEVARVGLTEAQARAQFDDVRTTTWALDRVDRAVTEHDTDGFIKAVHRANGTLLGATIVAERAGEVLTEFTAALERGARLTALSAPMRAYPTYSSGVAQLAGAAWRARWLAHPRWGPLIRRLARWWAYRLR